MLGRARRRRAVAMMTLLGFPEGHTHTEETVQCYWALGQYCLRKTGNRKLPPISLPDWLEWSTKELVFFPAWQQANAKQMWRGTGRGTAVVSRTGAGSAVSVSDTMPALLGGNSLRCSWSAGSAPDN